MKKIKLLLLALCALTCIAFPACDLSGMTGDRTSAGDSLTSESQSVEDETPSSDNGEKPGENEQPGENEKPGEGENPGEGEKPGEGEDLGEGEKPDEDVDVPDGKLLVTAYFYTIQTDDGENLNVQGLVDNTATLNDFFALYMPEIKRVYNEFHGFTEDSEFYYDEDFFTGAFWQIGGYLQYGDSVLSACPDLTSNAKTVSLYFTPSGAGINIEVYDECDDPMNPIGYPHTIPFPFGVYFSEFVDWMYKMDIFDMTYEQSVQQGSWKYAYSGDPIEKFTFVDMIPVCYVVGMGEGGGDVIQPTEITVYIPAIYGYSYSEEGKVHYADTKLSSWTIPPASSITVEEAYFASYGDDPDYNFLYYMDGVAVDGSTVITETCAVVCVADNIDVALPAFTLTVSVDGYSSESYTYTRPVTMFDAISKYCKSKGLHMDTYTWEEVESVVAGFDIHEACIRNVNLRGYIYVEPEAPTTATVEVVKYDGVNETESSYVVEIGSTMSAFITKNLLPEYDSENIDSNEYTFHYWGDYFNQVYGGDSFYGNTKLLMIKKSVVEAGYTVTLDYQDRNGWNENVEQTMYYPATVQQLIHELTGNYLEEWDMHEYTVNGEVLQGGEKIFEAFTADPQYKNVTIKVRPIFYVYAVVDVKGETEKTAELVFKKAVTIPEIAEELGLDYDANAYCWRVGSSQQYYNDMSMPISLSETTIQVTVSARRVYTDIYFVDKNGMYMRFENSPFHSDLGWEWSVTPKEAFETMIGTGEDIDSFDDFTWTAKGPNGEFAVGANDVLNYVIPAEYDYYDEESNYRTVYSLTGVRKMVTVTVEENGTEKGTKTYKTTVTLGEILAEYGYTQSDANNVMVQPLWADMSNEEFSSIVWGWNTVVTWPIRITVYKY